MVFIFVWLFLLEFVVFGFMECLFFGCIVLGFGLVGVVRFDYLEGWFFFIVVGDFNFECVKS